MCIAISLACAVHILPLPLFTKLLLRLHRCNQLPPSSLCAEFERLGIRDQPLHEGSSQSAFPANTNILYVGLGAVRAAVDAAIAGGGGDVLPGLIFNLKKKVRTNFLAS
jgi:hypothetical protein